MNFFEVLKHFRDFIEDEEQQGSYFVTKREAMDNEDWIVLTEDFHSLRFLVGGNLDLNHVDNFDSVFHCCDWEIAKVRIEPIKI